MSVAPNAIQHCGRALPSSMSSPTAEQLPVQPVSSPGMSQVGYQRDSPPQREMMHSAWGTASLQGLHTGWTSVVAEHFAWQ